MVEIVPATPAHAEALAATMRPEDVREVAALGLSPLEALRQSAANSDEPLALLLDGEVAAMFGAVPLRSTLLGPVAGARVWALSGRAVERHPVAYVKASRAAVTVYLRRFPFLYAEVDARYDRALRWVRVLGFTILPARPIGARGEPFHPIVLER